MVGCSGLTPPEVAETANVVSLGLLPEKSRILYEKTYREFIAWCGEKQVKKYSESVMLAYFAHIVEKGLIASLWPKYSMLRSTLNIYHNVDISQFKKLICYIKRQKEGYKPKKSKVSKQYHIKKFLSEASDSVFLKMKVSLNKN